MAKEHFCCYCNFNTNKKYNFDMHLSSKLHKIKKLESLVTEKDNEINILKNKLFSLNNKIIVLEKDNDALNNEVKIHKNNIILIKELYDSSNEMSKKYLESNSETSRQHAESTIHLALALSDSQKAINNTGKVATKSIDAMKFVMENYKDAPNIEDIPIILTEDEMKALEINPVTGSTDIIKRIYIDGIDPKKRSAWCMDASRLKFTTRHKGEWISDPYGKIMREIIMKQIVNQAHKRATNIFQGRNPKEISTKELKDQTKRIDKIKHINQEKTQEAIIRRVSGDFVLDKETNDIR
jgi:hypothetical protein